MLHRPFIYIRNFWAPGYLYGTRYLSDTLVSGPTHDPYGRVPVACVVVVPVACVQRCLYTTQGPDRLGSGLSVPNELFNLLYSIVLAHTRPAMT